MMDTEVCKKKSLTMANKTTKEIISNCVVIGGLLVSLVFNYYLYARVRTGEQIEDKFKKTTLELIRSYEVRLDSAYAERDRARQELQSKRKQISKRANNDKKDITKSDSLIRNIRADKLDSLWKNSGNE